jgi:hypothetical protein
LALLLYQTLLIFIVALFQYAGIMLLAFKRPVLLVYG